MDVAGKITELVVDIGVDAVKDRIKDARYESELRQRLNDYLNRQQEYNLSCTHEEEIDFQGIAEYIRGDLLDDVKRRLFGNKDERRSARQNIMDKAAYYAKAKTGISQNRARNLVSDSIDVLSSFYRKKVNRDLKFIATEIEDTIIDEMTAQHQLLDKKIEDVGGRLGETSVLSIDRNIAHIQDGNLGLVEQNLSTFFNAISSVHTLPHDFRFDRNERGRLISVPINDDALKRYPPRFVISAKSVKMGDIALTKIDDQILSQAFRHQIPISFDAVVVKKYLGEILDPAQTEAEDMAGAHVILNPPQFKKAFPCNVSIDGNVAVEYLLLRTKEILDDGTIVITNDEQKNFNFKVRILIDFASNHFSFSVTPTEPTNYECLRYRIFLKKASVAEKITVKSLAENVELFTTGKLDPIDFDKLDDEIEFLEKIVAIERFFGVSFCIPQELRPQDHLLIHRLSSMIKHGVFHDRQTILNLTIEVSELSRNSIVEMKEDTLAFAYDMDVSVTLFDQTLEFPLLRRIDDAKIENLGELKKTVSSLNDGDIIKLKLVPANQDGFMIWSDAILNEASQQKLLYSHAK